MFLFNLTKFILDWNDFAILTTIVGHLTNRLENELVRKNDSRAEKTNLTQKSWLTD